jgi:hypothetical protein
LFGDDEEPENGSDEHEVTALQVRGIALELYKQGEYAQAQELLSMLLDAGFEVPSTCCHLARIALVTDEIPTAREHSEQAWEHRSEGPRYVVARILWLRLAAEMAVGGPASPELLGLLKTALQPEDAQVEWSMEPVLEHLKSRVSPEGHALLTALVAALSFQEKMKELDAFAEWRQEEARSLE